MSMAIECLHLQWKSSYPPFTKFDMSQVFSISIPGPNTCHSQVVRGVVVRTHLTPEIRQTHDQAVSILVVAGDVSSQFRHAGYKRNAMIHQVVTAGERDEMICTRQQLWLLELEQALKRTNVGLVSVQGQVDSSVLDLCSKLGISIVDGVNSQQQTALCNATGATKLTYLHLAQTEHVGKYVTVSVCNGDTPSFSGSVTGKTFCKPELAKGKCYVIIQCVKEVPTLSFQPYCNPMCMSILIRGFIQMKQKLQILSTSFRKKLFHLAYMSSIFRILLRNVGGCTAMLCSPSSDIVAMMERNFWKCCHRISNCLSSQCILPGGGQIEYSCLKHLQLASRDPKMGNISFSWVNSQIQPLMAEFRPVAYTEFASAFRMYVGQTAVNMGQHLDLHSVVGCIDPSLGEKQEVVYDDFCAKSEAWKRAGNLIKLLVQTDNIVLSKGHRWHQRHL